MYITEDLLGDGINFIEKLQSYFANMNLADKSRYDRHFHKVTHKGVESAMNYITIFQNSQALSVSVGNNFSEDQLMHIFMYNFHQGGKYSAQVAIHQRELKIEEKFTDQKSLFSSLQTYHLNLDSSSGFRKNSERANLLQTMCTFCGGANYSAEKNSNGSGS